MGKIRYKRDDIDFATELRTAVKDYFKTRGIEIHGNTEIWLKSCLMTFIYFVPYVLMLSGAVNSLGPVLLCWIIMGLGVAGLGLATMHDANHGAFSKYRWANKLFGYSLYLLGGFPSNWKHQHNTLHHGYTNIDGQDEDIGHGGILRFSPHKPLKKVHRYQYIYAWFFYGLMTFSWVTVKDFKQLIKYKKNRVVLGGKDNYDLLFAKLLISKVLYYFLFLILPILLIPLPWYWILMGFFIMHFTSGIILSTIFQTAHVVPTSKYPLPDANNEMDNDWAVHQLYTTSDFAPKSHFFSWLIGGLNYQVVHHLFPNISHVHYKNMAAIVQEITQKHHLPYHINKSFFGAVYQHALMLKSLGKKNESYNPIVYSR